MPDTNFRLVQRTLSGLYSHPVVLAASVALMAAVVAAWRTFGTYPRPMMSIDSALFQHAGWYITTGAVPYIDIWDIKPPLAYLLPVLFAIPTTDPYQLHVLSVTFMVAVYVGCVVVVYLLAKRLTGDSSAALIAGISMLVLPAFHYRPLLGYKPKYLVVFTGLLGLYLYFQDRPFLSGMAVAAAIGFRQTAIIYPLLVLGLAIQRRDRRSVPQIIAGMAIMWALYLGPIVYLDATVPMIVQIAIAPLLSSSDLNLPFKLYNGLRVFRFGSLVVLLAGLGAWRFVGSRIAKWEWWIVAGAVWEGLIVVLIEFESYAYGDLIPGLPFVALFVGYLYHTLPNPYHRRILSGIVVGVILVNVASLGGFGLVFEPHPTNPPVDINGPPPTIYEDVGSQYSPAPQQLVDVRYLYWNQIKPETCHYRYSMRELVWIQQTGRYPNCGSDLLEAITVLLNR